MNICKYITWIEVTVYIKINNSTKQYGNIILKLKDLEMDQCYISEKNLRSTTLENTTLTQKKSCVIFWKYFKQQSIGYIDNIIILKSWL